MSLLPPDLTLTLSVLRQCLGEYVLAMQRAKECITKLRAERRKNPATFTARMDEYLTGIVQRYRWLHENFIKQEKATGADPWDGYMRAVYHEPVDLVEHEAAPGSFPKEDPMDLMADRGDYLLKLLHGRVGVIVSPEPLVLDVKVKPAEALPAPSTKPVEPVGLELDAEKRPLDRKQRTSRKKSNDTQVAGS